MIKHVFFSQHLSIITFNESFLKAALVFALPAFTIYHTEVSYLLKEAMFCSSSFGENTVCKIDKEATGRQKKKTCSNNPKLVLLER